MNISQLQVDLIMYKYNIEKLVQVALKRKILNIFQAGAVFLCI